MEEEHRWRIPGVGCDFDVQLFRPPKQPLPSDPSSASQFFLRHALSGLVGHWRGREVLKQLHSALKGTWQPEISQDLMLREVLRAAELGRFSARQYNPPLARPRTPMGESVETVVPPPSETAEAKTPNPLVELTRLHGEASAVDRWQCVNLPHDGKWVDGEDVHHVDQLGRTLRFKAKFQKPQAASYELSLEHSAANAAYTGGELKRNANFTKEPMKPLRLSVGGRGEGTLESGVQLPASGGDVFMVKAKDDLGNEAVVTDIRTFRKIFYQFIPMKGIAAAKDLSTAVSELWNPQRKHFIRLREVHAGSEMKRLASVGADTSEFLEEARKAYKGKDHEPFVVAIAFTDHLAVKDTVQLAMPGVEVGPGMQDFTFPVQIAGRDKYLWNNLVPGEDWFVSGKFLPDDSSTSEVAVNVSALSLISVNARLPDASCEIKVKASQLAPKGMTGTLHLTLNVVNRMRGGLSFQNGNLICVCTRAWWRTVPASEQNEVIVHELGHKLGLVPDGSADLDQGLYQYSGKGHVGSHCHHGLKVANSYSEASGSKCVMFGSVNGVGVFCEECSKAVRKLDLSKGWPAF